MLNIGTISSACPEATDRLVTLRECGCPRKKIQSSEQVELSLDSDVLNALHKMGEDWETHFNAILREWLRSNSRAA
jgi:uncharacterized protein (DUF4415 family)